MVQEKTSTKQLVAIRQGVDLLRELVHHIDPATPIHNALAFLIVAENELKGELIEVRALQRELGISAAACSRIVGALGDVSFTGNEGWHLVTPTVNYMDRRRKPLALTERGAELVKSVARIFDKWCARHA